MYDVATAADAFSRVDENGLLDLEKMAAFVSAYDRCAPLVPVERELLADAMIRRNATLVWYVISRHGERSPGDIGGAARYAARVTEIADAYETIRSYVSR
jgi:Ser/Thr protein kinase RdoA (MazF antagonist)